MLTSRKRMFYLKLATASEAILDTLLDIIAEEEGRRPRLFRFVQLTLPPRIIE